MRTAPTRCADPLLPFSDAKGLIQLMDKRRLAELSSTKIQGMIRKLDAKVWQLYGVIKGGTCDVKPYTILFQTLRDRLKLEEQFAQAEIIMKKVDESMKTYRPRLDAMIRDPYNYTARSYIYRFNGEENLT
jgi:hypothetical protein